MIVTNMTRILKTIATRMEVCDIHGCEDQCVISISDDVQPEFITRGRNALFLISTRG